MNSPGYQLGNSSTLYEQFKKVLNGINFPCLFNASRTSSLSRGSRIPLCSKKGKFKRKSSLDIYFGRQCCYWIKNRVNEEKDVIDLQLELEYFLDIGVL